MITHSEENPVSTLEDTLSAEEMLSAVEDETLSVIGDETLSATEDETLAAIEDDASNPEELVTEPDKSSTVEGELNICYRCCYSTCASYGRHQSYM